MGQSNDGFYKQPYRYGEKNLELRGYNRNRDLTGLRGYPSDKEYMKTVADSNKERDDEAMRRAGDKAVSKKKVTTKDGSVKISKAKSSDKKKRITTKR